MSWLGLRHKGYERLYPDEWNAVVDGLDILYFYTNSLFERVKYTYSDYGVFTVSGDGVSNDLLLGQHKLPIDVTDPTKCVIECVPVSMDAIEASPVTCYLSDEDGDGVFESIRARFHKAPASGTNNVRISYFIKYFP